MTLKSCIPYTFRSSHRRCSIKKVFLKTSQNQQENTCARVSLLVKLQVWGWYRCFPVNFEKFLRTHFYRTPTLWWKPQCRGEGALKLRGFNKVRQRVELNWASQLQPSRISSAVKSRPELSQCWWCSDRSTILPFCWVSAATKVSEEEGSYVSCFYG